MEVRPDFQHAQRQLVGVPKNKGRVDTAETS
jgi:hypothetical protein